MNIVQLTHPSSGRRVAIVEEPFLILLEANIASTYQLFSHIISVGEKSQTIIHQHLTKEKLDYDLVYTGNSEWKILPPIDCPDDIMQCIISGTGLTHLASAENRQKMHDPTQVSNLTDSMKMYLLGEEGGKPADGKIGVQPEWFYKGNGLNLKGHGVALTIPNYANDGGDEPEIAGVYLISNQGVPYRIGFVQGNEFSDHIMERKNYLYLAPSKLRNCSIGPELITDIQFGKLPGEVMINRNEKPIWQKEIATGEEVMAHSLANLEHHHFKYEQHRIPGQLHIHFFGAGAFSFGESIHLQHGDEMHVHFTGMGRPLKNSVLIDESEETILSVKSLL